MMYKDEDLETWRYFQKRVADLESDAFIKTGTEKDFGSILEDILKAATTNTKVDSGVYTEPRVNTAGAKYSKVAVNSVTSDDVTVTTAKANVNVNSIEDTIDQKIKDYFEKEIKPMITIVNKNDETNKEAKTGVEAITIHATTEEPTTTTKEYVEQYVSLIDGLKESLGDAAFVIPAVRHVSYCTKPGKEAVIVVFEDNTKVIKRPVGGDKLDVNVGVALAMMEKLFGSKLQYHKFIASKDVTAKQNKKKAETEDVQVAVAAKVTKAKKN